MAAIHRRQFIQSSLALSAIPLAGFSENIAPLENKDQTGNRFKISLNAYSFNAPLTAGKTTLDAVIDFCAAQGFDAVDLTGYYFPGYPEVPADDYIYHLKRKAHMLGLAISGTGIRNEFAQPDKTARIKEVDMVKRWIEVAAKLGAPVIRIYTGKSLPENFSWEVVAGWISENIRTCVEYGKTHGVIVAVQNHNDFIKTADQAINIVNKVNSEWFGLVLDTGSFITNEPYSEIAKASPYAVNWQIKEMLNYQNKVENMDLVKLFRIIRNSSYRGCLPIETLSPGDPFVIIPPFLQLVQQAMQKVMQEK